MKKLISLAIRLLLFGVLIGGNGGLSGYNSVPKLDDVLVFNGQLTSQILFKFSRPFYFERVVDENALKIILLFPGMDIRYFKEAKIEKKIKLIPIVRSVNLYKVKKPIDKVVLEIVFSGFNKKDKSDGIVIKWRKTANPPRLLLDIFQEDKLRSLRFDNNILMQASNKDNFELTLDKKKQKKILRVVVDAGHGGSSPGAVANGLIEKNVNLNLARLVRLFLKNMGFNVFLTRYTDIQLSLDDRIRLARQLHADIFLSLHVDAAHRLNVDGITTYYLKGKVWDWEDIILLSTRRTSSYARLLAKNIDFILNKKKLFSKKLANSIQSSVVTFLRRNNINITDRGCKDANFVLLLGSEVPACLVEVGFLTNKKEAKLLGKLSYLKRLAYGISTGVKKFIESEL